MDPTDEKEAYQLIPLKVRIFENSSDYRDVAIGSEVVWHQGFEKNTRVLPRTARKPENLISIQTITGMTPEQVLSIAQLNLKSLAYR